MPSDLDEKDLNLIALLRLNARKEPAIGPPMPSKSFHFYHTPITQQQQNSKKSTVRLQSSKLSAKKVVDGHIQIL